MAIVTTANTVIETSYIIYKEFEIGQSCTIYGYVTDYENQSVLDKGEQVLKNIQILYNEENVYTPKDGRS